MQGQLYNQSINESFIKVYQPRMQESMQMHSSLQVGGEAEMCIIPHSASRLCQLLEYINSHKIARTVLGGGSNILVSDQGIKGITIVTTALTDLSIEKEDVWVEAGMDISHLTDILLSHELAGMENFYSMPGSIGGAVWMNARCYGREISDVLREVVYANPDGSVQHYTFHPADFSYKHSPFQDGTHTILRCRFSLHRGKRRDMQKFMQDCYENRKAKGHFLYPSAGSIFKNNRDFGAPTGKILDTLSVRGLHIGDAQVSEQHANMIVNRGKAQAHEIRQLIELLSDKAHRQLGIELDPEIIFVGEWEKS